ncbi:MAG: tetratricopeptide repeat protein [Acidobacteriota bacterium]
MRRRVQADPASIAFAQLAEECRRSGANDEAVGVCRAGLAHHPDYLSARITLGRALIELGRLDEAQSELMLVLNAAPENLPAIRAIAELHQQRGEMPEALGYYKRALELAKYDADLEHAVERIESVVTPPPPAIEATSSAIEDLFDFDTLLEQLDGRTVPRPEAPEPQNVAPAPPVPSELDAVQLRGDEGDPFAMLERQLREIEERPLEAVAPIEVNAADAEFERDQRVMAELKDWLGAIMADRDQHAIG